MKFYVYVSKLNNSPLVQNEFITKSIINIKFKICNLTPKKYSAREYAPQKLYKL